MKWLAIVFAATLGFLQYRLWFDEGGATDLARLEAKIAQQQADNLQLAERNHRLAAEVQALKLESEAIEERARTDLGMIKEGETFYMIVSDAVDKQ